MVVAPTSAIESRVPACFVLGECEGTLGGSPESADHQGEKDYGQVRA